MSKDYCNKKTTLKIYLKRIKKETYQRNKGSNDN